MSREVRSPVYQIDFTAVDAGKRIASSKRRIRWRFGFTNQDALAAGETGTACRGEEHDITLIWSLTSGKRLVLADGQEVHYSNSRSQVFDFSWTMRGNHVLKVVAYATTPMNANPSFRQYDFFVDGMSFFTMPKVYRLGLTGADQVQDPGTLALAQSSRRGNYSNYSVASNPNFSQNQSLDRGVGGGGVPNGPSSIAEMETPANPQEEEAYLREAIKASLSETDGGPAANGGASYNKPLPQPKQEENLLIDFMSEPGPAPAPAPTPAAALDTFAMVPAPQQMQYHQAPPPTSVFAAPQQGNMSVASQITDPYGPPQPVQPAPMQAYNSAYAPAPSVPAPVPVPAPAPIPPAPAPLYAPAAVPVQEPPMVMEPAPAPVPVPESAPTAAPILTMAPQSTGLGSDANAAYEKFASMDQFDLVKTKPTENRSNPFDDPVGPAPTSSLADMKAKNQPNGEKKEVMKNNSVVVAQQQAGNWGGYSNYGMNPVAQPPGGQYGMSPAMAMQQPQQPNGQQIPQYGGYQQQQQPPPMQYGAGMNMQGGQQYQQPQPGFGQPQQPF